MKPIRTVTLSPCFDLHYTIPDFEAGKENFVTNALVEAGGKGINTSRALCAGGIDNLAYLITGTENAAPFLEQLRADGLTFRAFETPGRIRENLTVHPGRGKETRVLLDTFCVSEKAFEELEAALSAESSSMLLAFSGRIPRGIEKTRVLSLLARLAARGAEIAVDSVSLTPDDLRALRPWLIKPNEQEIKTFLGKTPATPAQAAEAAKELVKNGVSRTVMISLGGDGAAFSDGKDAYVLRTPRLTHPLSTVGAGDSTVAGLLAGAAQELPLEETLRLAVAYGTASCLTPGTRPPRKEDIQTVFAQTRAEKL